MYGTVVTTIRLNYVLFECRDVAKAVKKAPFSQ